MYLTLNDPSFHWELGVVLAQWCGAHWTPHGSGSGSAVLREGRIRLHCARGDVSYPKRSEKNSIPRNPGHKFGKEKMLLFLVILWPTTNRKTLFGSTLSQVPQK